MDRSRPGAECRIAELVNRLGRAVHCLQFSQGLNPAQWEALRYMARANRYSRTPSALAAYLGTTKGTASQTVKALESKGYLRREAEPTDRRVCRLVLTKSALRLLERDPIRGIGAALAGAGLEVEQTLMQLDRLMRGMQSTCGMRSFGVCECCEHFGCGAAAGEPDGPHRCGLTGEPLSEVERTYICVNFQAE